MSEYRREKEKSKEEMKKELVENRAIHKNLSKNDKKLLHEYVATDEVMRMVVGEVGDENGGGESR